MTWRGLATLPAIALLLAGCATATQDRAVLVRDDDVPFGLLDELDPVPRAAVDVTGERRTVYLVNDEDLLVALERPVLRTDPDSIVAELAGDLTDEEVGLGLRTLLDSEEQLPFVLDAEIDRGVATIDLAPSFLDLQGEAQVLALAQLVLTLTSLPGVGQVAINVAGVPAEVPRADGTTTSEPVAAIDYAELVAP